MCRNIRILYNVDPPATQAELHDAALQFVRKVSGYRQPSKVNTLAFEQAVGEIEASLERLFSSLETNTPARPRTLHMHHREYALSGHR